MTMMHRGLRVGSSKISNLASTVLRDGLLEEQEDQKNIGRVYSQESSPFEDDVTAQLRLFVLNLKQMLKFT